jgi:hypothetical protein
MSSKDDTVKKLKKLQIEALINDSKSKRSYTQIRTTG